MQKELNDRLLRSVKTPDTGRLEISDTKRKGLRFRLSNTGSAVFMYEKRIKGGPKRKHTLGSWPGYTLSQARADTLTLEVEAAQGIDRIKISEEKKISDQNKQKSDEKAAANRLSVLDIIDLYDKLHLSTLKTGRERRRQLEQNLGAHLHSPIQDLTRQQIQTAIDRKAHEGKHVYANRIRAALLAFANWAYGRSYLTESIGLGVPKAIKETARDRVLSLEEIHSIWRASFTMGNLWGPILRLLILTGQRRSEIVKLKWDEINLNKMQIIKVGSKTKNKKAHTTHLSAPALQTLLSIKKTENDLVFTTTGTTPVSGISKMKKQLDVILGDEFKPWRLSDFRTAMATALAENGEAETIVDRILNHSASGSAPSAVARVYNQAENLTQRAAALETWGQMVTAECPGLNERGKHQDE